MDFLNLIPPEIYLDITDLLDLSEKFLLNYSFNNLDIPFHHNFLIYYSSMNYFEPFKQFFKWINYDNFNEYSESDIEYLDEKFTKSGYKIDLDDHFSKDDYVSFTEKIIKNFIKHENLPALKFLHEESCMDNCLFRFQKSLSSCCNIEIIEWFFLKNPCMKKSSFISYVIIRGNMDMVKMLYSNGFSIDEYGMDDLIDSEEFETIKFIIEHSAYSDELFIRLKFHSDIASVKELLNLLESKKEV